MIDEINLVDNTNLFKKRLNYLYKQLDSKSSLLWSHENSLHVKGTRSKAGDDDLELKWKNKETTQIGYGEISKGSLTYLINLMQNISSLLEFYSNSDEKFLDSLIYAPTDYNINENSLFLDIGSGFGKPVFHVAFQVGCESKGIEVVPARVEFCLDFFYEYINDKQFFSCIDESLKYNEKKKEKNEMEVDFINHIKLNDIQGSYYNDIIKDKSTNLYIELRINQNLIHEDSFTNLFYNKNEINKPILFIDNYLKFGNYFSTESISIEITPVDDHLYSSICKIISFILNNEKIDRDLLISILKTDRIINLHEAVKKVENLSTLNLISYVNTMFGGFYNMHQSSNKNEKYMNEKKNKEFYQELLKYLENKEKILNYGGKEEKDDLLLKETLTNLKFNMIDSWYKKINFVSEDATKVKSYMNDSKQHFTHIYAYNKLMSKECRKKIASILNKTNYKVLAWYSNPKQSLKAGLKDFTFICKFPMQSTSTEKFHVYVYIKTK